MEEEFQESEVMFQDHVDEEEAENGGNDDFQGELKKNNNSKAAAKRKKLKSKKMNASKSLPVNIPDANHHHSWFKFHESVDSDIFDDRDYGGFGGVGEMEPPHVIIGRRIAGRRVAFSVCTGNGRTLKGRDLSQVRNSILRMTGFLET